MRRWFFGVMMALVVLGAATITSYVVLDHFYGERYVITSTQTVIIENFGQQVSIDNVRYDVEDAEFIAGTDNDNVDCYIVFLRSCAVSTDNDALSPPAPSANVWLGGTRSTSVPKEAYERAQATREPITVSNTTTTETKPIDALPIAVSIGIGMGIVVFAVWVGYRQLWGDAASTLLEHGLHDMTVRDVEIVRQIMELKEFTIPELMKLTKASKITVWRTVQKLVERGLVQPTEQTRLAANGLGGRGKPSCVYRYVGSKDELKT